MKCNVGICLECLDRGSDGTILMREDMTGMMHRHLMVLDANNKKCQKCKSNAKKKIKVNDEIVRNESYSCGSCDVTYCLDCLKFQGVEVQTEPRREPSE
jgi:hypothetical protein